ncbi:MAG: hypothetical protein UHD09_06860 [Bifidobacterium sp.]|nr:hypothetical protein [Bifidobacterium sp.]
MSTDGFRRTGTGVVGRVVAMLGAGRSVHECAEALGLPDAFIEQVADDARRRGLIDVIALDTGCTSGHCTPDPDSIVCAGCPLAPRGASTPLRAAWGALSRRMRRTGNR